MGSPADASVGVVPHVRALHQALDFSVKVAEDERHEQTLEAYDGPLRVLLGQVSAAGHRVDEGGKHKVDSEDGNEDEDSSQDFPKVSRVVNIVLSELGHKDVDDVAHKKDIHSKEHQNGHGENVVVDCQVSPTSADITQCKIRNI